MCSLYYTYYALTKRILLPIVKLAACTASSSSVMMVSCVGRGLAGGIARRPAAGSLSPAAPPCPADGLLWLRPRPPAPAQPGPGCCAPCLSWSRCRGAYCRGVRMRTPVGVSRTSRASPGSPRRCLKGFLVSLRAQQWAGQPDSGEQHQEGKRSPGTWCHWRIRSPLGQEYKSGHIHEKVLHALLSLKWLTPQVVGLRKLWQKLWLQFAWVVCLHLRFPSPCLRHMIYARAQNTHLADHTLNASHHKHRPRRRQMIRSDVDGWMDADSMYAWTAGPRKEWRYAERVGGWCAALCVCVCLVSGVSG